MNNNLEIHKPSLDSLFTQQLHDLVNAIANRHYYQYGRRGNSPLISQEDLAQEGMVAVAVAYKSFNPSLGYTTDDKKSFRTHAWRYITSAMRTHCVRYGHPLSISEKAARRELDVISSIHVVRIDSVGTNDNQHKFDIPVCSGVEVGLDANDYLMIGFSQMERDMLTDHILNNYSLAEVGSKHGMSKSRASEIIIDLTARMKPRAEEYVKDD